MKSLTLAMFATAAMFSTLSVTAKADDKTDITALYVRLQHAMKAQSPEQLLALLAPDFSHKTATGDVQNGKKFTDQIRVQHAEVTVKDMQFKVTSVIISGKTAHVTNEFSWSMDIIDKAGQLGPIGRHHVMTSSGRVENNLEKTTAGWRFLTLNTVNGKVMMDGKLMVRRPVAPPEQSAK